MARGQRNEPAEIGFRLSELLKPQPGAAQIAQVDDFAFPAADLPGNGQRLIVEGNGRGEIAPEAGRFRRDCPHRSRIASIAELMAQRQALLEEGVCLRVFSPLKANHALEFKAVRQGLALAQFEAEALGLSGKRQHRIPLGQPI